ncbi:MAG: adenylate/guanylate cyclase domain-containing protein [Leptospiraceae bacterium]|nr:adenylate/guanylate cyclase domain-containing protein [Leptospiraceae bacterium]MCB1315089.1 adenylate/guanylate cyclase domain-containing protein [Leptospiraceae bacterium]
MFTDWSSDLDFFTLVIGPSLRIKSISRRLMNRLGYDRDQLRTLTAPRLFAIEAFQELFIRKQIWDHKFKNYRTFLRTAAGDRILCQLSGYRHMNGRGPEYRMVLQELQVPKNYQLDTGSFEENLRSNQIIKKYISRQLASRALSAVRSGYDRIPDEEREFTFLFADLVAYTSMAEKATALEILEMLNLSIGATASIILHNGGFVDKIMGDSIFAVFEKPLSALMSAIEIQKQFNILNLFRIKQGQDEVQLRIGIHSGQCLLASIGSDDFMELTFIGDSVNTASRLEKSALPGSILVSDATFELIKDNVENPEAHDLTVKGKRAAIKAYYINRIQFDGPRGRISLGVDDDMF